MKLTPRKRIILSMALEDRIKELKSRIVTFTEMIENGDKTFRMDAHAALKRSESELIETIAIYEEVEGIVND